MHFHQRMLGKCLVFQMTEFEFEKGVSVKRKQTARSEQKYSRQHATNSMRKLVLHDNHISCAKHLKAHPCRS